jgi:hypothetical protein
LVAGDGAERVDVGVAGQPQADASAWVAFFARDMARIASELRDTASAERYWLDRGRIIERAEGQTATAVNGGVYSLGANVFSGQGAGTGVRQSGKKDQVSVVAFDASPTQVEDLRRGNVDGLIAQHPNDIGDTGVRVAVDYLKSEEEPAKKQITTGFTTVTRENLDKPEVQEYLYKAEC